MDTVLILNTEINIISVDDVAELLQIKDSKTIAICNTNTLVRSYKDSTLQKKINSFDVRTPDGFPVAKASKWLYKNNQERVDGYNVFHETIKKGLRVGEKYNQQHPCVFLYICIIATVHNFCFRSSSTMVALLYSRTLQSVKIESAKIKSEKLFYCISR